MIVAILEVTLRASNAQGGTPIHLREPHAHPFPIKMGVKRVRYPCAAGTGI